MKHCYRTCFLIVASLWGPAVLTTSAQTPNDTVVKLPAVEITDSIIRHLAPVTILSHQALQRAAGADVSEVLRQQPNISGIRKGGYAIDPVVRGFRYSQLNIFLDDGIHIEGGCPNRMDPVLSRVSPEAVQRIEVIRGPYLLQYGPSPAASIRVVTRAEDQFTGRKVRFSSFTGYDANRNGIRQYASLSGSTSTVYYTVSGGLGNMGNYTDGNGTEWNSSFIKKEASAGLGIRISPSEVLNIDYRGSFGSNVLFPALPMDEIADNTHIFDAVYQKSDPGHPEDQLRVSAYHTRVYHEMDNRFRPQYSAVVPPYTGLMQAVAKVHASTTGIRGQLTHKYGAVLFSAGVDGEYICKDGTRDTRMIMNMDGEQYISEKRFNLWKDGTILNTGIYTGLSSGNGKFSYSVTARLDLNHGESGDTLTLIADDKTWFRSEPITRALVSFAGSLAWQTGSKTRLTLGLARGTRAPDLQERYIKFLATGYDKFDYLGNPQLKPEVNYQSDLMLEYSLGNSRFYVNLFGSFIRNFITGTLLPPSVARPVSMGAPGVKQFNNIKQAVLTGFELGFASRPADRLNLDFAAGYTYAFFPETEKILLENGQATGVQVLRNDPLAEIPALEARLGMKYEIPRLKVSPGMSISATAAQNRVSSALYEEKTPGYLLMDILAQYRPFRFLTLTTGISNLFNKAYYNHLNRKITGSGSKLFEPGRTFYINLNISIG